LEQIITSAMAFEINICRPRSALNKHGLVITVASLNKGQIKRARNVTSLNQNL